MCMIALHKVGHKATVLVLVCKLLDQSSGLVEDAELESHDTRFEMAVGVDLYLLCEIAVLMEEIEDLMIS